MTKLTGSEKTVFNAIKSISPVNIVKTITSDFFMIDVVKTLCEKGFLELLSSPVNNDGDWTISYKMLK